MITTYKFGLQTPTTNALLASGQIKLGHDYQNNLIGIECWRRSEIRAIESKAGNIPQLEADLLMAEQAYDAIAKRLKSANAKARAKVPVSAADKTAKADAKKAKKTAEQALKDARRDLRNDPDIQVARDAIYEIEKAKQRELRKSNGAPWYGTYMLIENAFDRTRKMPFYDGVEPNDPRFRRFDGSGRLGIHQFQPHEPISKVIGDKPTSTMVQIVPMPAPPPRKDGSPRKVGNKDLRLLRVRIGTVDGKITPIWAEFPMVYHRPMPVGSVIQRVQVSCRKIAQRERWTVSITVNDNQPSTVNSDGSAVGIDLGWRTLLGGLRVAKWHGSDGKTGEMVLPQHLLDRLAKVEEIKSGRDKDFDRLKTLLSSWISSTTVPDWFATETKTLDKWRSQARAVRLLRQWKTKRFTGDEEIWEWLEYWRYHDFHLWQYERSLDAKTRGHRRELYRIEAAKLAEQYGTIVFEDIRLDNMAKGKIAGGNRFLSAPSEFRNACKNATRTRGKGYEEVSAINTSKLHAKCGTMNDIGAKMEYRCVGCGEELDRDENAAENILNRWLGCERSGDAQTAVVAREVENISEIAELASDAPPQSAHRAPRGKEVLANQVASV